MRQVPEFRSNTPIFGHQGWVLGVQCQYFGEYWPIYKVETHKGVVFVPTMKLILSSTPCISRPMNILHIISTQLKPLQYTVYPKKYAHGFCFAVLCCGYTLTDFPISIRLTSLALWQSNDCPSASKATLMNMDKYFMWIHYERLHNHNKAKHNKTMCIFLGIYCKCHGLTSIMESFFKPMSLKIHAC